MELVQIIAQFINGLDKGSAYAMIALGLTLIFGTLGVVNFAHGALFGVGAYCTVFVQQLFGMKIKLPKEEGQLFAKTTTWAEKYFGADMGGWMVDWSVPLSIILVIPFMIMVGVVMERGLIRHFYNRPHADQILVTFGLAICLQEFIKLGFGAGEIPVTTPTAYKDPVDLGVMMGFDPYTIIYPGNRLVFFTFSLVILGSVFALLRYTTFGMVVRAGMADRETVGMLGININRRFTLMFALACVLVGLAGAMYAPIKPPVYTVGMEFLVLSFVVVVVGGMGSLPGAVAAGFLLGILESFASLPEVKNIIPGIDQVIIYLVAVVILLTRPRGLMGRKGVMED